jgi:hypothetical protein
MRVRRRALAIAVGLTVVLMASTALAGGAQVTMGSLDTFADGPALGYQIDGKAHMVRTADGKTIVKVNASGLMPGETYGSHVHNQACDDDNAGGHYRFDVAAPGGDLNGHEIWPGPFTANAAGNAHGKATVAATAGGDAVSVVIHAPSGQKIACADLS